MPVAVRHASKLATSTASATSLRTAAKYFVDGGQLTELPLDGSKPITVSGSTVSSSARVK